MATYKEVQHQWFKELKAFVFRKTSGDEFICLLDGYIDYAVCLTDPIDASWFMENFQTTDVEMVYGPITELPFAHFFIDGKKYDFTEAIFG